MAHVLIVTARQHRDPVPLAVLMEMDDGLIHDGRGFGETAGTAVAAGTELLQVWTKVASQSNYHKQPICHYAP